MFFFSSGSSILPYFLSLVLIWGVFLINVALNSTVQKEIKKKNRVTQVSKYNSKSLKGNTYSYHCKEKSYKVGKNTANLRKEFLFTSPGLIEIPDISVIKPENKMVGSYSFRGPPQTYTFINS